MESDVEKALARAREGAQDAQNGTEEVKEALRIISKLTVRPDGSKRPISGLSLEVLLKAVGKLAMLNIRIGLLCADMVMESNYRYVFRKFRQAREYTRLRKETDATVKDCEADASIEVLEDMVEHERKRYEADVLKTLYDSINVLISVIQTYARRADDEKKQVKLNM